ncbi:hypothetical protein B0H14DRAFT_2856705 [Mycena olivaceomarginata]|nr:hypothetical protein B0H14DRAFT_2856705 [Mycena olivaceomarginata]
MLVHGGGGSYRSTSPSISFQPSSLAANPSPKAKDHAAAASAPKPQISRTVQNTVDATVVDHSIPEDIQSVVAKADSIMAAVLEFRGTNPYEPTLTLKVPPDVWDALKNKYEDQVGFKMEYYAASDTFIVTWPSWVHENLDVLFSPFTKISIADPLRFRCLYNKDMRIMTEKKASDLTPDLQFARLNSNGEPEDSIIVECAVAQTADALWKKAENWVRAPHIQLVIAINVAIEDPPTPSGPKVKTALTMQDLDESELPTYGPITINGRIWGGKLRQILVRLYFLPDEAHHALGAKFETVDFDITPGDDAENTDALDKALDDISDYLSSVTLDLITQPVFETCFPTNAPFDLKWDDFYKSFARGLRLDALHRHNRYNNTRVPEPQIPKVDVSKRRQTNQPYLQNRVKKRRT